MKKILSILGTISLSTIISTNIIACKPTNKENKTSKPIEPKLIPQQPPTNSNWKLIDDIKEEKKKNFWLKTYIEIIKESNTNYKILNSKGIHGTYTNLKAIYRWDGINEPIIPTIDKNTGEIIDWNE